MRKFLVMGVSALSTATLALGVAGPANAVVSPPGSVVSGVCGNLPAQLLSAATSVTSAVLAQTTANTNLLTATTALTGPLGAQSNLVAALVDYLQTVDSGGSVAAKALVLEEKVTAYSAKAAAWANAWSAVETANRNVTLVTMVNSILGSVGTGLACP